MNVNILSNHLNINSIHLNSNLLYLPWHFFKRRPYALLCNEIQWVNFNLKNVHVKINNFTVTASLNL